MKKLITSLFTLLLLIAFTSQSDAQLELRAGLSIAKIKAKVIGINVKSDPQYGAQLGVAYSKSINEKFSIRPGIMYTSKGGTFEDEDTGLDGGGVLGYVGIPLDFVLITPINDYNLKLHIGPYFDYLLHGEEELTEDMKNTDFGFNYGAELDLGKFGFGLNFSSGIQKVLDEELPDPSGLLPLTFSQKNIFTSIYLTYDL